MARKRTISNKLDATFHEVLSYSFYLNALLLCIFLLSIFSLPTIPRHATGTTSFATNEKVKQILYPLATPRPTSPPLFSSFIKKAHAQSVDTPVTTPFCLNVPVIMYHHVEPLADATAEGHAQLTVDSDIFETQMKYLSESGYTALTSDQLVQALLLKQQLPPKSIVITFDDGYADWYPYVYPILQKYSLMGNFFISSGLLDTPGYLTLEQMSEMAQTPYVSIYNHTSRHIDIGNADRKTIESEMETSDTALENALGKKINIMAYPYGSNSPLSIQILKEFGFIAAFTTNPGRVQCDTSLMTLKRDHVGNAPLWSYGL